MTQQIINIGDVANDGQGDPLRTAFTKTNDNFTELYNQVQVDPPASPAGQEGDVPGMIAFTEEYLYVCVYAYDATSVIWYRVAFSNTPW
jgi:hypothetical protein